jgi:abhydrolase domain-containing protein 12
MNKLGMNVFAWDYTGFGKNSGNPSQGTLGKDSHDFFKTSVSTLTSEEKIILWGHSLGTGAIFQLLRCLDPEQFSKIHAVILEAPFISILGVVHDNYLPKFLQGPTAKYFLSNCLKDRINSYDVVKSLKKLPFKVLILHSTRDADIPFRHGKEMQAALEEKTAVTFKEIDSHTHNLITLRDDFQETLEKFLKNAEE